MNGPPAPPAGRGLPLTDRCCPGWNDVLNKIVSQSNGGELQTLGLVDGTQHYIYNMPSVDSVLNDIDSK